MSNKSDSIAKLALALSKLQGEVTDAHKDKSAYNYKYADLAGVLEIARPLCLKYELAVSQLCTSNETGIGVKTLLMHSSGEWIESELLMPVAGVKGGNHAQAAGAVITYARRYALAAILGITQTDNDAQVTAQLTEHKEASSLSPLDAFKKWCAANNIGAEEVKDICNKFGVERFVQLSPAQVQEIMESK